MTKKLYEESDISAIATAIRGKNGSSDTYKVSEMADAISNISGGGITPTGTKQISITSNGTTTEDVTNYASASITVNVPTSGGSITGQAITLDSSLWANYGIVTSNSNINANTARITNNRAGNWFHKVEAATGYSFNLFAYHTTASSNTLTYDGVWNGTAFDKSASWQTEIDMTDITNYTNYVYRLTVKRDDGTDMSTSEGSNITFYKYYPSSKRLPSSYQEVEYIESGTGNLGFTLGAFRLPSAFRLEVKAQLQGFNTNSTYGNVAAIFQPSSNNYGYELAYKKADNTIVSFMGTQSVVTPSNINDVVIFGNVCTGSTDKAYIVVNGERVYGSTVSVSRNYNNNLGIFYGGDSVLNQFVGKLYYLTIWNESDEKILELVPCYRVADGAIGLYDMFRNTFYTNANDTYTKGSDVS